MEVVVCKNVADMQDFACAPDFTGVLVEAVRDALNRLDRLQIAVVRHSPTNTWILHTHQPVKEIAALQRKLATVERHSGVKFGEVMHLDIFHGEQMELFGVTPPPTVGWGGTSMSSMISVVWPRFRFARMSWHSSAGLQPL